MRALGRDKPVSSRRRVGPGGVFQVVLRAHQGAVEVRWRMKLPTFAAFPCSDLAIKIVQRAVNGIYFAGVDAK